MIVQKLATFIRSAGGLSCWSPNTLMGKGLMLKFIFLLILVLSNPAAPYYASISSTALTALGAARFRERQKHSKYDSQAKAEGATFFPFVLETYGGFGAEASTFIHKISKLYCENSPFPVNRNTFTSKVSRTLSITLQRGNALVLIAGSISARDHAKIRMGR